MNQLLSQLIPYVRKGEITLKTCFKLRHGVIENIVIYSDNGSFFLRFSDHVATTDGLAVATTEISDWEIEGIVNQTHE